MTAPHDIDPHEFLSDLLASAAAQAERFRQTADDVVLGVMPFNHVGGLTCTIGATLVSGGAVALLPRFHPDLVAQEVPARRVTMFVGVPTMFRMMLGSEEFAGCDVSSVRLCVVGGSNLEPELAGQVRDRFGGPRTANLYGLSETSGACIISPAEVENFLTTDPSVTMCAVIGVPDTTYGETGHAFVVPAPGADVDTDALLRLCATSLAEYKVPARIEVVDSLPMTPADKIRKVLLTPAAE